MTIAARSTGVPANGGQADTPPVWAPGNPDTVTDILVCRRTVTRHSASGLRRPRVNLFADLEPVATPRRGLRTARRGPGPNVVCILDNNVDAIMSWLVANFLGAVRIPVNTAPKGEYLRHQINGAAAAVVITKSDYASPTSMLLRNCRTSNNLVVRGRLPELFRFPVTFLDALTPDRGLAQPISPAPHDLAMLIYTSGTTSPSKCCMISHNYVCNVAKNTAVAARSRVHLVDTVTAVSPQRGGHVGAGDGGEPVDRFDRRAVLAVHILTRHQTLWRSGDLDSQDHDHTHREDARHSRGD